MDLSPKSATDHVATQQVEASNKYKSMTAEALGLSPVPPAVDTFA